MKTMLMALVLIVGLFSVSITINSCSKSDKTDDLPKEQQVVGKWDINRIQLKIYSSGVFIKDTIIPQTKHPNFVRFDSNGNFEYKFNATSADIGIYQFVGVDSIVSNSLPNSYRWKILTLTSVLFTVVNTTTDPAYPGAIVERYQTFVR